jgi:hypothetical protein
MRGTTEVIEPVACVLVARPADFVLHFRVAPSGLAHLYSRNFLPECALQRPARKRIGGVPGDANSAFQNPQ